MLPSVSIVYEVPCSFTFSTIPIFISLKFLTMIYKVTVVFVVQVSYLEGSREYTFSFCALIYLINVSAFWITGGSVRHEEAYTITASPTRARLKRR